MEKALVRTDFEFEGQKSVYHGKVRDVYPFCGTSGICKNSILPLGAIVLLSQSKTNTLRRLGPADALQGILNNIYLDFFIPDERLKCTDLIIELFSQVPVYHFGCTPDEEAVKTLADELKIGN